MNVELFLRESSLYKSGKVLQQVAVLKFFESVGIDAGQATHDRDFHSFEPDALYSDSRSVDDGAPLPADCDHE